MIKIFLSLILFFSLVNVSSATVYFSDGFESGDHTQWTTTETIGTGSTLEAVATPIREGAYSSKSFTTNQYAQADFKKDFTASNYSEIYVRWYMYIPTIDLPATAYLVFIYDADGNDLASVGLNSSQQVRMTNNVTSTTSTYTTSAYPFDGWACMELRVQMHDTTGDLELWMNGTKILAQNDVDTKPGASAYLGDLMMGIGYTGTGLTNDFTVYKDSVVVSDVYVGPIVGEILPFSDGFESGDYTAWTSTETVGTGTTLAVDVGTIKEGTYSSKSFTTNDEAVSIQSYDLTDAAVDEVYIRMYIWVSTVSLTAGQNLYLGGLVDSLGGEILNFQIDDPDELLELHSDITGTSAYSASAFPFDQWNCLELRAYIHASAGDLEMWLNGAKVCAINDEDTLNLSSAVGLFGAGISYSDDITADVSVFIDSVEMGTSYIGPIEGGGAIRRGVMVIE